MDRGGISGLPSVRDNYADHGVTLKTHSEAVPQAGFYLYILGFIHLTSSAGEINAIAERSNELVTDWSFVLMIRAVNNKQSPLLHLIPSCLSFILSHFRIITVLLYGNG